MLVKMRVKTGKRENRIERGEVWEVHLKSAPEKGKANKELIKLLKAEGYDAKIISGFSSHTKIVELHPRGKNEPDN